MRLRRVVIFSRVSRAPSLGRGAAAAIDAALGSAAGRAGAGAARGLVEEGVKIFVEVGPGNVLGGLVKRIDRTVKTISVNNLAGLKKAEEISAA